MKGVGRHLDQLEGRRLLLPEAKSGRIFDAVYGKSFLLSFEGVCGVGGGSGGVESGARKLPSWCRRGRANVGQQHLSR